MSTVTKHDSDIAREELDALFASLCLPVIISEPRGEVKEGDWPCITYTVTIYGESFEWSCGVGHVDWKNAARRSRVYGITCRDEELVKLIACGNTLKNRFDTARLAAGIALKQNVKPSAAEVLACVCEDGLAADQSFDNWCADYGYDTDSRKAESIYNKSTEYGKRAKRLVGAENYKKFAKLHWRL